MTTWMPLEWEIEALDKDKLGSNEVTINPLAWLAV